jgi:hypothetical protein
MDFRWKNELTVILGVTAVRVWSDHTEWAGFVVAGIQSGSKLPLQLFVTVETSTPKLGQGAQ